MYTPITVHCLCWTGTGLGLTYSAAIVAVNLSVHTYNRTLLLFTGLVYCADMVVVYTYNRTLPVLDRYGSGTGLPRSHRGGQSVLSNSCTPHL